MSRKKLSDALKEAIHHLSHKEKDKLLYRLIAKDDLLTEQLEFRLLENRATTEDRRSIIRDLIIDHMNTHGQQYTPGSMLWSIRKISAMITRHTRVTGDKYGEIELNLLLVKECLAQYGHKMIPFWNRKTNKLREYLIKKVLRISKLSKNIHPDYRLDFADSLHAIGDYFERDHYLMEILSSKMIDVGCLQRGEFYP